MQESDDIDAFIVQLQKHQLLCEKEGKYMEAMVAGQRLEQLEENRWQRKMEALKAQHTTELLTVENAHVLEIEQFHSMWNARLEAFESEWSASLQSLLDRQQTELVEFDRENLPEKSKIPLSKEALNIKHVEEMLAKKKDYAKAHQYRQKFEEQLRQDSEKAFNKNEMAFVRKRKHLLKKHEQEVTAFNERRMAQQRLREAERTDELQVLTRRFANVKKELASQQLAERKHLAAQQKKAARPSSSAPKSAATGPASTSGRSRSREEPKPLKSKKQSGPSSTRAKTTEAPPNNKKKPHSRAPAAQSSSASSSSLPSRKKGGSSSSSVGSKSKTQPSSSPSTPTSPLASKHPRPKTKAAERPSSSAKLPVPKSQSKSKAKAVSTSTLP
eukprot:GCRY01002485.1.p1 GENE.GCRY01002485.1~~GCRY01002485.1.p1  ORF type:complete len:386 (+),score=93.11 GCRY01002485.1:277-1434(+)